MMRDASKFNSLLVPMATELTHLLLFQYMVCRVILGICSIWLYNFVFKEKFISVFKDIPNEQVLAYPLSYARVRRVGQILRQLDFF